MLEKIGNSEVYVRNYTSNFDIKEYIQSVLIPKAFPNIKVNKLNLGFTGIVSEIIAQGIEDAYGTASLMMNEAFITKAVLPRSIYAMASLFDLGYTYATPSKCNFALEIDLTSIEEFSTRVNNTPIYRYVVDKDTRLMVGDYIYRLDYDIYIDHQIINGKRVYSVYYNMDDEPNSISDITNKFINYRITNIGWLVLLVELKEFNRRVTVKSITDNQITVNSDINISWADQLASFDLVYISPLGKRTVMIKKHKYTAPEENPFAWFYFNTDNSMTISFSNNAGYFQPEFNSSIEITLYTCLGSKANFDEYSSEENIPVSKTSDRFEYNASSKMVALCYGASKGGKDRGSLSELRNEVIAAYNTAKVLTTDSDFDNWFETEGKKYNNFSQFVKRRDDPSGRLYSQFVLIDNGVDKFGTNTLDINVNNSEFDAIDGNEYIIDSGHLWEYVGNSSTDIRMIKNADSKPWMISDQVLPELSDERSHIFTNPFVIKINRQHKYLSMFNCLIDDMSYPEEIDIGRKTFYQFQISRMRIYRTLSGEAGKYNILVACSPSVEGTFVSSLNTSELDQNNLRLIMILKSKLYGDTGYIEMTPISVDESGVMVFSSSVYFKNTINNDIVEVDLDKSPDFKSLIKTGDNANKVFVDVSESMFNFITLMKTDSSTGFYNDEAYINYTITNRFSNTYRNLNLFEPLTMMRSNVTFTEDNEELNVKCSLIPMLDYNLAKNDTKMASFINIFNDQYKSILNILNRLDSNVFLDVKLFNSYGRSNNYYIGPELNKDNLYDSDIKLDSVYIKIKFRLSVKDRSIYSTTLTNIKGIIKQFVNDIASSKDKALHISNLIRDIENNVSNVNYIRFIGFNSYDALKQSIFLKNNSSLSYVPEILTIDDDAIEIIEEI